MELIAVSAGKGGVGKSCVAAYTGAALAKAGKRVLLIELGAQPRSLDMILGTSGDSLFHIKDLVYGRCDIYEAMTGIPGYGSLCLIPSAPGLRDPVAPEEMHMLLGILPRDFDYVIADGVEPRHFPADAADMILLVVTPELLAIRAAADVAHYFEEAGCGEIRLVINRVPPTVTPMKGISDFDDIIDMVGARLIAVIPQSQKLNYASNNSEFLGEDSLTPQVFARIASRVMGEDAPLLIY